ncbi:hypothetical protein D3C80_1015370 [compost metagenome]
MPGIFRRLFDAGATGQHDQVCQGDFLAARVELTLDTLKGTQHLGQLIRLVGRPELLRGQAQAPPIGAPALVGATEGGSRRPGRRHQLRDRQA